MLLRPSPVLRRFARRAFPGVCGDLGAALRALGGLKDWEAAAGDRAGMGALDASSCAAVAASLGFSPGRSRMRVVHVAGSKGKGSVCALVGAALAHRGRRVGVITSPHAYDVRARRGTNLQRHFNMCLLDATPS